jgi:hypothetical protein
MKQAGIRNAGGKNAFIIEERVSPPASSEAESGCGPLVSSDTNIQILLFNSKRFPIGIGGGIE